MNILQKKQAIFARRKARIRAKITGTAERPRLTIFKSHKYIYAQIIDDTKGHTLLSTDTRSIKGDSPNRPGGKTPVERAKEVGIEVAKKAKAAKITKVVFDRNGYLYAGKIKTVADAAREGGLEF